MSKNFDGIVDEIRFLRWSLIPPYCENLDEDEKSSEEYERYYAASLSRCIGDSRRYLEAVEVLALSSEDGDVKNVFSARSEFIQSFPFCSDELIGMSEGELKPYLTFMAESYRKDSSVGELQKNIAQYIDLLERLRGEGNNGVR